MVIEGRLKLEMSRKLIVKKFGGTSVGDVARIQNVAKLVDDYLKENPDHDVIVVVSAMSGETNKLIQLANSCVKQPSPRELDVLLATGEQVTIALTAMALQEVGRSAASLIAQQVKIATDSRHNNASILDIDTTRVKELLAQRSIPVIAGFQGIDDNDDITTLGRGGSDITAVALAAALKADACWIYTDVEGVYSTDPRICKTATKINKVCHEEMLEMASLGAKVLHPRSVYFAMTYNVPLLVLSTFNPKAGGTWIVKEEELMEKPVVTGITYRESEAKITIAGIKGGISALEKLFGTMAEEGIFIDMITQAGDPKESMTLSFTLPEESSSKALDLSMKALATVSADKAILDKDIAKVSVVGVGMRYHTGVAAKTFAALAKENIPVSMISTSEVKISVVVPRKYYEVAVRVLHEKFVEYGSEGVGREK